MNRILIADDECIEREYLRKLINENKDQFELIGEANNGIEAVRLAESLNPDAIIMDIKMPLLDGLEASKIIRKSMPEMVIILNSAYSEFDFAQKAINYDLDAYLLKPASKQEILYALKHNIYMKSKEVCSDNLTPVLTCLEESFENSDIESISESIVYIENTEDGSISFNTNLYMSCMFKVLKILYTKGIIGNEKLLEMMNKVDLFSISKLERKREALVSFYNDLRNLLIEYNNNNLDISYKLKKYLDENYKETINLKKISAIYHFSPNYLSRKFHEDNGITIVKYLNSKRISVSKRLLKETNMEINNIAKETGFNNIHNFIRVFKKENGKTPQQYREEGEEYENQSGRYIN